MKFRKYEYALCNYFHMTVKAASVNMERKKIIEKIRQLPNGFNNPNLYDELVEYFKEENETSNSELGQGDSKQKYTCVACL